MKRIGIIGAGAWGTALALVARRAGLDVIVQAHEAEVADAINASHENPLFLPGVALDEAIRATTHMTEAAADAGAHQIHETGLRVTSGGGASIERCADLAVWLAGSGADGLSGRIISAFNDDFESLSPSIPEIMASDLYTLRRVDPV